MLCDVRQTEVCRTFSDQMGSDSDNLLVVLSVTLNLGASDSGPEGAVSARSSLVLPADSMARGLCVP